VRNADFGGLQETFLVSAVVTILVIRTQLWATNYPQLGGHGLHIAHLLWGGIFMVIAIGMLLTYLGRRVRHMAALSGGIGFGFFIDEVGKFITSDNNYFFKPAAAIIYTIFIGLFLLSRKMRSRRRFSPIEHVCNALDLVGEAARRDLDAHEKHRALELLSKADDKDPIVVALRRLLEELEVIPAPRPGFLRRRIQAARNRYFKLVENPGFTRLIGLVFGVWAVVSLIEIVFLALVVGPETHGVPHHDGVSYHLNHLSVTQIASMAVGVISAVLVAVGIYRLVRGTRLDAYRMFALALLVEIYVGEVFAFVDSQFTAVFALVVDILLLVTIRYMIRRERHLERRRLRSEQPVVVAAPASNLAHAR
jgi:hypothetical protein